MDHSLSIILPVQNAQRSLAAQVGHLLDVLPDLTRHFEIIIVDDGSVDLTEEMSREMARQYPQVQVVRHVQELGVGAAIQSGLAQSAAEVVFVHDDPAPVRASDLRELWALRDDDSLLQRLVTWTKAVTRTEANATQSGGTRMFRRQALAQADSGCPPRDSDRPSDAELRLDQVVRRDRASRAAHPRPIAGRKSAELEVRTRAENNLG